MVTVFEIGAIVNVEVVYPELEEVDISNPPGAKMVKFACNFVAETVKF